MRPGVEAIQGLENLDLRACARATSAISWSSSPESMEESSAEHGIVHVALNFGSSADSGATR